MPPAAPAPEDFAIIVGIDHYPHLGTLNGPVKDAAEFERWVISHGVKSQNVLRALSSGAPEGEPSHKTVDGHFLTLCDLGDRTGSVGRRLYVFMAGHGISQSLDEASLLTANARAGNFEAHVPGRGYCNWFRMAAYFEEIILFVDCCRTDRPDVAVRPFPRGLLNSPNAHKIKYLYGFAARYGQAAGERDRGFFSRALLEGLTNGRTSKGTVTSTSLKEFLLNHPDLAEYRGRQDPELLAPDDIVLAKYEGGGSFPVRLKIGPPAASTARIRGGDVEPFDVAVSREGGLEFPAPRGLYAVEVANTKGLFEVSGTGEDIAVSLSAAGSQVHRAGQACSIRLVGNTPATEVYLIDSTLHLVAGAVRELHREVRPGVYKARFQLGAALHDELVDISEGEERAVPEGEPGLRFTSPVPLKWARPATDLPAPPELPPPPSPADEPTCTISIRSHDAGAAVEALSLAAWDGSAQIALSRAVGPGGATAGAALTPGMYVLRLRTQQQSVARAVPVFPGRTTRLFLELPEPRASAEALQSAFLSSAMVTTQGAFSETSETVLMTEIARQALERQYAVFYPSDISEAIRRGVDDPLFALYAVHAWLEGKRRKSANPAASRPELTDQDKEELRAIHAELSNAFGDLPDVAVLGGLCGTPARPRDVPPLLRQSWRLWKQAAVEDDRLMPESSRVVALAGFETNSPLWWAWEIDGERPARRQDQAVRSVFGASLRPDVSRAPLWAQGKTFEAVVLESPEVAAKSLQLPRSLAMASARALDEEEQREEKARLQQRLEALVDPSRPLCLVSMPSGMRIDSERGTAIDFESVYEDVIEPAVFRAGWAPVRFLDAGATLSPDALRERARLFDVLVADVTFADPAVLAELGYWVAQRAQRALIVRATSQQAAVLPGFPRALDYDAAEIAASDGPLEFSAVVQIRKRPARRMGADKERRALRRELASLCELRGRLRELRRLGPKQVLAALTELEEEVRGRRAPRSKVSEAIRASMLAELFFARRSAGDFGGMLRLAESMPVELEKSVVMREQRAYALNRGDANAPEQRERRRRALELLHSVIRDIGPNGETCGLLGSIYKAEWAQLAKDGDERAATALDNAIQWYSRGVEATPADPYPGINAVTLLLENGGRVAMDTRERLLPLVEVAASRRLRAHPGYWDYATMVELAVHRQDRGAARRFFELAVQTPHSAKNVESTAGNLEICRKAFKRLKIDLGWIQPLCAEAKAGQFAPMGE